MPLDEWPEYLRKRVKRQLKNKDYSNDQNAKTVNTIKRWRQKNKHEYRAYQKRWREKHPDYHKVYYAKRKAEMEVFLEKDPS